MKRYATSFGADVLVEESHAVPVVDVAIVWRLGAIDDPPERLGTARMLARLLRRGARGMGPTDLDEEAALLGGRFGISVSRTLLRIHGTVLSRNLAPFVGLLGRMLCEPALRARDLTREKRRVRSEIEGLLDEDGSLAARQLRRGLFDAEGHGHPLAQPVGGELASIRRIQRRDLVELHGQGLAGRRLLFGAAGDVNADALLPLLEEAFGSLPRGRDRKAKIPAPRLARGRHVFVIDKEERSQTQLAIGTLGARVGDPDLAALVVADTSFGSLFSSRLMQAVRENRGWSYSAYSHLGAGIQRDAWAMWTHPSVANARDCAALEIELMEEWVEGGLKTKEIRFAKKYLVGSRCMDEDTPGRRLELAIDSVNLGFPEDRPQGYIRRIRAVDRAEANAAVRKRLDPSRLAIVAVGAASQLAPRLETLPGIADVTIIRPKDLL